MLAFFRHKQFLLFLAAFALLICVGCGVKAAPEETPAPEPVVVLPEPAAQQTEPTPLPKPQLKYIFLFIGDGMGYAQVQAASEALASAERDPLCFIDFPVSGSAHTNNVDGGVTDSAAAATAIATGTKTLNTYLGLDSTGVRLRDISEELRDAGRKIGVLTTVSLDHATPAGFFAHVTSRRAYDTIADDLFASGFNFFAGGGFHNTPDAAERAAENGYTMISSFEQAPAQTDGNLILSSALTFGDYGVIPAIDGGARQNWLKKATDLAIERLASPDGFFMMVEGGRIDYFCHYADAASFVSELLDFDAAIASALTFYSEHPTETLIVVTADHETGDVSLIEGDRAALLRQTLSGDFCDDTLVAQCILAKTPFAEALPLFISAFGLDALSSDETDYLKTAYYHTLAGDMTNHASETEYGVYDPITSACLRLVAARAGVVFSSDAHTSKDVPVYAIGLGADLFSGSYENTWFHDAILQAVADYPVS